MKRFFFLAIIATLVLGLSGVTSATLDSGQVETTATIGQYAQISGLTDLPAIQFTGSGYEQKSQSTGFWVASNCPIDVILDGTALSQEYQEAIYQLSTRISLRTELTWVGGVSQHVLGIDLGREWPSDVSPRPSGIPNPFPGWGPSGSTFLQGMGKFGYHVRVMAWTGDIHEQPFGDYSGTVTITIAANSN